MSAAAFAGLDLLATAVVLLDRDLRIVYVNPAAESMLEQSARTLRGQSFLGLFENVAPLGERLAQAIAEQRGIWNQATDLERPDREPLHVNLLASPLDAPDAALTLELRSIDQRLRLEREERELAQAFANRELIRNLAHEIKNPLGGLRGSAQLLERELDRPALHEYTQVIIKEADRLQLLVDRLLTPHRPTTRGPVNIHEVSERVRSLILAEFPELQVHRDYDASLPELLGDREQLIQAVLNVARNAAQAVKGRGEIVLRTRVARFVTIAKTFHRSVAELDVIDNGPGVPDALRDRVFHPLVSGREGGTGLGLTLAQTYVQHHRGAIECESQPGRTVFRILLPLAANGTKP
ncbi:MAG: PAS domain-containing protein [Burkholderiales bacterium]|nr:PAS domain-containing protein [Burkholderiales bacterium]